jgi:hypothetical protein
MAVTHSQLESQLPHWAKVQYYRDVPSEMAKVYFGVLCTDGRVAINVAMSSSMWEQGKTRREVLEDMIEQLTVQLATLTLEEK